MSEKRKQEERGTNTEDNESFVFVKEILKFVN